MNSKIKTGIIRAGVATFAGLLTSWAARAQLPTGSAIAIAPTATNTTVAVTVTEPANHVWRLQSSPDLQTWTTVETLKVHNGRFRRVLNKGASNLFYRGQYDSSQQTTASTVLSGLLLPSTVANYANPTLPAHYLAAAMTAQINTPTTNLTTDHGATLGRVLFYDKRLSANHTVACASCHQAQHGFSDPRKFSVGFQGGLTDRNSMGLTNAKYYQRRAFFWDERAATLEDQVLQPIQNSVEMGMTLPDLVTRLSAEPFYATLFTNAFGDATVTSERISRALAQFVRSIISTQSKFDIGRATNFANFTAQENTGRNIFNSPALGNCAACHGTENFAPTAPINNNGLENPYIDKGLGARTGRPQDEGLFKVNSLRNIELTAPYMHDGRFATLEQVVEFYNSGVVAHPNLSPPLRNGPGGPPRRLNLTPEQKAALVAFMKTLTDTNITNNPQFGDPFNYGDTD
jgi:cytochrome c peroxidase